MPGPIPGPGFGEVAEAGPPVPAPATPAEQQELPAVQVPQQGGAATSGEAHSGGDTGPSTPGPTLMGNVASPGRDGGAAEQVWLSENKDEKSQRLEEQAGSLETRQVNRNDGDGTEGELPPASSPGGAHPPGAAGTPPLVL